MAKISRYTTTEQAELLEEHAEVYERYRRGKATLDELNASISCLRAAGTSHDAIMTVRQEVAKKVKREEESREPVGG